MSERRPQYLVGTSGWTYNDWKGSFYPEKLPRKAWLEYYASRFQTVEINATFYGLFKDEIYIKWRDQTPPGFRFVLKAPRLITHRKHLNDIEEDIHQFWRSASLLGDKFGLILLQIAPDTPYDPDRLRQALLAFENPHQVAVEFRQDQWLNPEVFDLLKEIGAVYCIPDSPVSRLSRQITSSTAYIRLHGRERWYAYDYPDVELEEIADLARQLNASGALTVYFFFNNDYHANAPKNALALAGMLT